MLILAAIGEQVATGVGPVLLGTHVMPGPSTPGQVCTAVLVVIGVQLVATKPLPEVGGIAVQVATTADDNTVGPTQLVAV